eukprot:scaffold24558_cov21-Tisochrysis_lutea.AAC.1
MLGSERKRATASDLCNNACFVEGEIGVIDSTATQTMGSEQKGTTACASAKIITYFCATVFVFSRLH